METYTKILEFWFGKPGTESYGKQRQEWFVKKDEFDREVRSRFLDTYHQAAAGELDEWKNNPESCLALIIIFDQFSRNMFRGQPQAFATDEKALDLAKYAVSQNYDKELLPVQRWFIYLPFEHSENLADQEKCLELFSSLKSDPESASSIDYAERHYQIIQKFGRFPHRNSILGRESTPEEIKFLQEPGSSF
ncbi:MAG: DUF924 family protein [Oscillatoria sp. PMC 1068.18]|nr:DUF924 family protein [Oscillatoria sp. PMC 1076.18]MEC4988597.1 DUF924 family protein [Oscillatoria sp. PMC 1068.18]